MRSQTPVSYCSQFYLPSCLGGDLGLSRRKYRFSGMKTWLFVANVPFVFMHASAEEGIVVAPLLPPSSVKSVKDTPVTTSGGGGGGTGGIPQLGQPRLFSPIVHGRHVVWLRAAAQAAFVWNQSQAAGADRQHLASGSVLPGSRCHPGRWEHSVCLWLSRACLGKFSYFPTLKLPHLERQQHVPIFELAFPPTLM